MQQSIHIIVITTVLQTITSSPLKLGYNPIRPFYAPKPLVYPQPFIPSGTPWPSGLTTLSPNEATETHLIDKHNSTSVTNPTINSEIEGVLNLTNNHQTTNQDKNPLLASSITSSNEEITSQKPTTDKLVDRLQELNGQTTPSSGDSPNFVSSGPFNAETTQLPNPNSGTFLEFINEYFPLDNSSQEGDLDDKIIVSTTTTVRTTTRRRQTVPNLSYVPTRPFYAPNPVVYPQPIVRSNDSTTVVQKVIESDEDKKEEPTTSKLSTVLNLNYEPSRPPFAPENPIYPQPVTSSTQKIRESDEDNKEMNLNHGSDVPNLSYVPSRPPFAGINTVYPQPVTEPHETTTYVHKVTESEEDIKETTSNSGSNVPNLSYVPSRPPFAGINPVYPQPVTESHETTTYVHKVTESDEDIKETTSNSGSNVPNLSYVPSRPPFAPINTVYPQPVTESHETTTYVHKVTESDEDIKETTSNSGSNVPNLSYVPSRPPFAGFNPVYPQPTTESQETTTNIHKITESDEYVKETSTAGNADLPHKSTPFYAPLVTENEQMEVTQSGYSTTDKSVETTTSYYDNLVFNLQQLLEFVQNLQNSTTTTKSVDLTDMDDSTNVPLVTTSKTFDVNKIAEVLKPLFTDNTVKTK